MTTLPIVERFYSWQGEGVHMGRSAYFIRTYGCPLHCPWCDSAGTWHPEFTPDHIERLPVGQLAREAKECGAAFVVLTGGEPMIHKGVPDLIAALNDFAIPVHVETSGAIDSNHYGLFDWVTLSPKWARLPTLQAWHAAHEIKIIVETENSIKGWEHVMHHALREAPGSPVLWLHPEWSQRRNQRVLDAITEAVKASPSYRAGWQIHKNYRADLTDARAARALIPLGGNPERGF